MKAKGLEESTLKQLKSEKTKAVREPYEQPKLESLGSWSAVTLQLSGGLGAGF